MNEETESQPAEPSGLPPTPEPSPGWTQPTFTSPAESSESRQLVVPSTPSPWDVNAIQTPQYQQPQHAQPVQQPPFQQQPSIPQQPQYGQTQQPQYAQPQYAQPQYAQPQYAQPQYGQPQYGQPQQPQYGQPQYGQQQFGQQYIQPGFQPPPYAPPSGGIQHPFHGRSVTVLVLGLISVLGSIVCVGPLLGPVALIMGLKVRKESLAAGYPEPGNNKAGWILGILGSLILIGAIIVILIAVIAGDSTNSYSY
jgi:hypothetical protein